MRREHFETLRPVCPVCRVDAPLALDADGDDVVQGILTCTNSECRREYPIIDGIPILVGPIRTWLSANPLQVLLRDDLSPELESLLGDVLGPGSPFDTIRHHTGIYAGNEDALSLLEVPDAGPVLDIGCAAGVTTRALAKSGHLTLGVDLNFAMLRVAARAMRNGRVIYPLRRTGVVYEQKELAVESSPYVDYWCCDAAALPFAADTFAFAASLNVLDCVPAPHDAVSELARVLQGTAVITTPYDWSASATPFEHWLGGHSQRGAHEGAPEPMLRTLLARHFEIVRDDPRVPWRVRLHDRATVEYAVQRFVVTNQRSAGVPAG